MKNWREWFVSPEDEPSASQQEDEIRIESGAGHQERSLHPPKKIPPRCASCKKFVGFDTGMHLMISSEWRIHISCFADVLEQHFEDGEVIDLTTGAIYKVDEFTD